MHVLGLTFKVLISMLLGVTGAQLVFAGTTGKITGQVTDAFGAPLPGAAVVIEGKQRGSETDEEGIYFLLSIEPGRHTLVAHMIGYESVQKTEVLVTSDFTTNVSFEMVEKPLQLGEIVVAAQSGSGGWGMMSGRANTPAVEADKTMSKHIVRGEDIEVLTTLRGLDALLELQGGVAIDEDGDEIFVRAGRSDALAFYVDGFLLPSRDHLYTRAYRNINRLAIQEMVVVTGGLDAEYGNAQSGVVSVVTREGKGMYGGTVDYQITPPGQRHWGNDVYESPMLLGRARWDDPDWVSETATLPNGDEVLAHPRRDYTGVWGHFLEGGLSVPLSKNATSFLSGKWQRIPEPLPAPYQTTPFNFSTLFKFSYQHNQSFKISGGGLFDRRKMASETRVEREETDDTATHIFDTPTLGGALDLRQEGRNIFINRANPAGDLWDDDRMLWVGFNHMVSKRTFYEVRLAWSLSQRDTANVPMPFGINSLSDVRTGKLVLDRGDYFAVHRDVMFWNRHRRNRLILKADLSSQVDRRHFIKTGLEIIRYDNWGQTFRTEEEDERWIQWYSKSFEQNGFFENTSLSGVTPIQADTYVQDKIELDGMVVNVGVRGGAFMNRENIIDSKHYLGSPMWNGMQRNRKAPTIQGKTIYALDSRLGISHPLGENSTIRFYYGTTSQFPEFENLYQNVAGHSRGELFDQDLNGNGVIDPAEQWNAFTGRLSENSAGDPDLKVEKTTSLEVGAEWNFLGDYVAGVTTFFKKIDSEIATVFLRYQREQSIYGTSVVADGAVFRDARGFEFSLKKRFSELFAFNFSFNLQWANISDGSGSGGGGAFPDSLFIANGHYWTEFDVDPVTGAELPVSLREMATREGKEEDYYIKEFGHHANNLIRQWAADVAVPNRSQLGWEFENGYYAEEGVEFEEGHKDQSFYGANDKAYWQRLNATPGYPGTGEGNILFIRRTSLWPYEATTYDRRSFASLSALFATPSDFGPLEGIAFGNIRANLLYRLYTGTPFTYTPLVQDTLVPGRIVAGEPTSRLGPLHTRTDLNLVKTFGRPTGLSMTLGIEIFNLFNQKDVRSTSPIPTTEVDFNGDRWQRWGVEGVDVYSQQEGVVEVHDVLNYWDSPREMKFSVQVKW